MSDLTRDKLIEVMARAMAGGDPDRMEYGPIPDDPLAPAWAWEVERARETLDAIGAHAAVVPREPAQNTSRDGMIAVAEAIAAHDADCIFTPAMSEAEAEAFKAGRVTLHSPEVDAGYRAMVTAADLTRPAVSEGDRR